MLKELNFAKHSIGDLRVGLKEIFRDELFDRSRGLLKKAIEMSVLKEFEEYIEVRRYRHSQRRKDWRNGYRRRGLLSTWGAIEEIRVPRSRRGEFRPRTFERYKRVQGSVNDGILKMFLMGISTRKVADVLQALFGYTLSAGYVSKLAKRLNDEVRRFFDRPLTDDFVYLFLDGIVVKVRDVSRSVKRTIFVAYGIRKNGSRELINFRIGKSEGKGAWGSFLENLRVRGLRGSNLKLIISDGSQGLWSAAREIYPFVDHQLCWVHKLRNVANKCPKRYLEECIRGARQIYLSPTIKIAMRVFRGWERTWRERVPQAVACLARDIDKLLQFLKCPPEHHRIIRTTNIIERLFREMRRRLKVMGTFPNIASAKRMTFGLFTYYNTRWERPGNLIKQIAITQKEAA